MSFSVTLYDPFGVPLGDASNYTNLKYTRTVNNWSSLTLTLPATFSTSLIRIPDGRIGVWRNLDGREYLDMETLWLIKAMEPAIDDNGLQTLVIEADTPLCILKEPGRFVNFAAGSSQAQKAAAPADDQIKAFVRDAIGSTAGSTRDLSALVSVASNLSQAPSIAKSAAWRDVLKTCQELATASANDPTTPTYLAFDIVAPSPNHFEFRTYTQQRGVDHRFPNGQNPVLFSPDMGNLGATRLRIDYRDEVTYALAGGQGDGSNRVTASSQDTTRSGVSPFGLREQFADATQYTTTTGLTAEAQSVVRDGRPRFLFQAKILETDDTRYGVEWSWGDFVTAQAFGFTFACRIDAVTVNVAPGKETIDAYLRNDQ